MPTNATNNNILQYQEGVIRTLFISPDRIAAVTKIISSDDFDNAQLKEVYNAILNLNGQGHAVTPAEVATYLNEKEIAYDAHWLLSAALNSDEWLMVGSAEQWARLLRDESLKKKSENALLSSAQLIQEGIQPVEVIGNLRDELNELAVKGSRRDRASFSETLSQVRQSIEENKGNSEKGLSTFIKSSYPSLDYYTLGWGQKQLITIAARTSVGKTVFAVNCAASACAAGKSVAYFSLEMSQEELIYRLISQNSQVPFKKIKTGTVTEKKDKDDIDKAVADMKDWKLSIFDEASQTVESIRADAINLAQSEQGVDMIIVDYIQLLKATRGYNRQEEVADISRGFKILAKQLGVPVMILAQINREKRGDEDQTPHLYDIRESAAIAQDSDVVVLIHRLLDTGDNEDDDIDPKATFIVAKNRNGETGKYISVDAQLETQLFVDHRSDRRQPTSTGITFDDSDVPPISALDDDGLEELNGLDGVGVDDLLSFDDNE